MWIINKRDSIISLMLNSCSHVASNIIGAQSQDHQLASNSRTRAKLVVYHTQAMSATKLEQKKETDSRFICSVVFSVSAVVLYP